MVFNSIKVFARLKKEHKLKEKLRFETMTSRTSEYEDIIFQKPGRVDQNSAKFRFHKIFDQDREQNEVFDLVAKPVVTSILQGFNGTILAYGQTGSGKTYSMTGSTKKYEERGIIPRCIQQMFSTIEKTEEKPTLYISYMEIYNEMCYDLLNPRDSKIATSLEELPRVVILEDKKGEAHLRNLSVLPVSTEEEAMRLLFLGDTNRAIAETPLNEYSSRSHCIFTIYVTTRPHENQSMTYSKLNLVDLAGSERVHKSNISGSILHEAKHINLSLHFLQQVILALSESKRTHIPFRNSILTFILKDSLAGKCLTVMLATLAITPKNIQETISTCKFAQRVALIKTDPVINEMSDPYQEILLLKIEVQELRKQLANRKPTLRLQDTSPLSIKQKKDIETQVDIYMNNSENILQIEMEPAKLQHTFLILKNRIQLLESKFHDQEVVLSSSKCNQQSFSENNEHGRVARSPSLSKNKIPENDFLNTNVISLEIDYYRKHLTCTYKKATLLAAAIDECQLNISYIREKLDVVSRVEDCHQKIILSRELESQQRIYRNSLIELRELKNETLQLESGLTKAKIKREIYFNKKIYNKSSIHGRCIENTYNSYNNAMSKTSMNKNGRHQERQEEIKRQDNCNHYQFLNDQDHFQDANCSNRNDGYKTRQQSQCLRPSARKMCEFDGLCCDWAKYTAHSVCQYSPDIPEVIEKPEKKYSENLRHLSSGFNYDQEFNSLSEISETDCFASENRKHVIRESCNNVSILPPICKYSVGSSMCHSNAYDNNINVKICPSYTGGNIKHCCIVNQKLKRSHFNERNNIPISEYLNKNSIVTHRNLDFHSHSTDKNLCTTCGIISPCSSKFQYQNDTDGLQDPFINNCSDCFRCSKNTEYVKPLANKLGKIDYTVSKHDNANVLQQPSTEVFSELEIQLVPDKLCRSYSPPTISTNSQVNKHSPRCQEEFLNSSLQDLSSDAETCVSLEKKYVDNDVCGISKDNLTKFSIKKYEIFLETDTEEFKKYIGTIPLTGDEDVDKEICNFYRDKLR